MNPPLKTCDNCRFHQVHTVHRLWPGYETWDTFDGSRCHCPEAMKNHKPDRSGGVRLGNFCWECRGKFWQPIEPVTVRSQEEALA